LRLRVIDAPSLAGFAHFSVQRFHVQRAPDVNCTVQAGD
jgi:hypothetical protein